MVGSKKAVVARSPLESFIPDPTSRTSSQKNGTQRESFIILMMSLL